LDKSKFDDFERYFLSKFKEMGIKPIPIRYFRKKSRWAKEKNEKIIVE